MLVASYSRKASATVLFRVSLAIEAGVADWTKSVGAGGAEEEAVVALATAVGAGGAEGEAADVCADGTKTGQTDHRFGEGGGGGDVASGES